MTGRDHLASGLSHQLVDNDGIIIASAWQRAVDAKEIAGTCRQPRARGTTCNGFLAAEQAYEESKVTWYEARCMKCERIVAAPNGKTLPRSSRRTEMPSGAWDQRMKVIELLFGKKGL